MQQKNEPIKPERPFNYRTNQFSIMGQDITIAGMAGPHNSKNPDAVMIFLKNSEKREALIGIHETENFTTLAEKHGIEYHCFPLLDYAVIASEKFDQIYGIIQSATLRGKSVGIHCGSGDGRSGTALAAIKLRELLEKEAHDDPTVLMTPSSNTTTVYTPLNEEYISCSPLVKKAIETIRMVGMEFGVCGINSVECDNDVTSLLNYEKHVHLTLQKQHLKRHSDSPSSMATMSLLLAGSASVAKEQLSGAAASDVAVENKDGLGHHCPPDHLKKAQESDDGKREKHASTIPGVEPNGIL